MIIYLPLLVSLIGLIIYALAKDPKPQAIGKDMFWTGLLVTLLSMGQMVNVLRR